MTLAVQPLGEVIDYLRGITFKPEEKIDPAEDAAVVCMRTKNVQELLDESDLIAVPSSLVRRDELYLREGDILLSSANSWNLVGKVCRVPKLSYRATAGGFISVVRARADLDSRYLYHWLSSPAVQEQIRRCARQTTNIANLSVPLFEQLAIPVPSPREQSRIADILDKADEIRRKRKEAIALTDALIRSTFVEMFGDIPAKRSPWPLVPLRPYLSAASGKSSKSVLSATRTDIPVFGGNGINGWASTALYQEPVVVVGRVGQQCGITHMTEGPAWVTDNAIVVSITASDVLHPVYLMTALQHSPLRASVMRLDLPFINQSTILDYPLPLPPRTLQDKFADLRSKTLRAQTLLSKAAADADRLFASLMHRAFRGELSRE